MGLALVMNYTVRGFSKEYGNMVVAMYVVMYKYTQ